MFRNLSVGQWVTFIVLSLFTVFGGFLYVAAEAHYNRRDRDFYATPAGQELMGQQVADRVARKEARAAVVKTHRIPFAVYIVFAIIIGFLSMKAFGGW